MRPIRFSQIGFKARSLSSAEGDFTVSGESRSGSVPGEVKDDHGAGGGADYGMGHGGLGEVVIPSVQSGHGEHGGQHIRNQIGQQYVPACNGQRFGDDVHWMYIRDVIKGQPKSRGDDRSPKRP